MFKHLDPRWTKVVNDLWDNKARTILVVIAIAVGVQSAGGMFTAGETILRELDTGFLATNPSNITMSITPFDDHVVNVVTGYRAVEEAEGQASVRVKVRIDGDPENTSDLNLFAVADYDKMEIDVVSSEAGKFPPDRREIVLERATRDFLGLDVGDTAVVVLPNGEVREMVIVGSVHDLSTFPATMWPEGTGYISLETIEWLGQSGLFGRMRIRTTSEYNTQEDAELIANDIKARLEQDGYDVISIEANDKGSHWSRDVTAGFTAFMSGMGLAALLLSAFLVVNTIMSILSQQQRQIGMMKAVGATSGQIMALYFTMVAAFGILALFISLPMGYVLGLLTVQAVAGFLNFDIIHYYLPLQVVLIMVAAALFAPLVAALFPVLGGTRVTVLQAITDYGVEATSREGIIEKLLTGIRNVSRPVMLSLRNTFRKKGRLSLTLGTLTLAGAVFMAVLSVRSSLTLLLEQALDLRQEDVFFALDGSYEKSQLEREALRIPGVTYAEARLATQMSRVRENGTEGSTFQVIGVPPESPLIDAVIKEGRWLEPGEENAILLSGEAARAEPDIQPGDEITLKYGDLERTWTVVGIFEDIGGLTGYTDYTSLAAVMEAQGQASLLSISTTYHTNQFEESTLRAMEDRFETLNIGVSTAYTHQTLKEQNEGQFSFMISFILTVAVFLAIIGGLGLMGTMSLNVLERTREFGVMRGIGASNGSVRSIVLTEGVLIGVLSWILALIITGPITIVLGEALGQAMFERSIPVSFSIIGVAAWLPIVLIIATIASLAPARRASRISVREALAYE